MYLLESAISFPGYKTWLYFDTGNWQTWNLIESRLIKSGKIEKDPTLKFHFFNNNSIAYYSKAKKKIEVLDIMKDQSSDSWKKEICKLPTSTALPEGD